MEEERELGMQQKHRIHIMNNLEKLIRTTDYNPIMTETVQRGLLSPVMRRNIEKLHPMGHELTEAEVVQDRHRKYFEKVTKRGPTAYAELKAIVRALGYHDALRILEEGDPQHIELPFVSLSLANSNKSTDIVDTRVTEPPDDGPSGSSKLAIHNDADGPLRPFEGSVDGKHRKVKKSDRIHTDPVLGTYPMVSKLNRGVLFIVNIIDFHNKEMKRTGADGDSEALIHIFREIGFTIFYYKNLNQAQFFKTLQELTNSKYVRDTECFVMVLMTHGERCGEMDKVLFSNGSISDVKTIINHFQSDNCPNLLQKPKVLIFPFCRGEAPDHGKIVSKVYSKDVRMKNLRTQTDGVPNENVVPTLSDILVCYASTPGFETHRDPDHGSWYIQKFCDTMADHAHDTSLEDILKKTQFLVGNMRTKYNHLQTGAFDNLGFNKKLFFNPGYFLDLKRNGRAQMEAFPID